MRKTAVASALGIFAGLGGGVLHGIGEILQGNAVPNGIMIEAWPALRPSLQNLATRQSELNKGITGSNSKKEHSNGAGRQVIIFPSAR